MFGYTKKPTAINLSNLTKVMESNDGGTYKIKELYFVPPIVPNVSCMFGVATYNNQMIVTLHAMVGEEFKQKRLFMDIVMKEIREL